MLNGISIFAGLGYSPEINIDYLNTASRLGYQRMFTSLHIPEADATNLMSEFTQLIKAAKKAGFHITADISLPALALFNATLDHLTPLQKLGIDALRLDFGFSVTEIARLTRESGFTIALNASTIHALALTELIKANASLEKLEAWHNYYPRPDTGLSYELFVERSALWQTHHIPVITFVPSTQNPRAPIFAGLPTLELHRRLGPVQAAKHLLASGLTDGIAFGDPLASVQELAGVAGLDGQCLELNVVMSPNISQVERDILLAPQHTNRTDPGEVVIRSQEARGLCHGSIAAGDTVLRQPGCVTIDNERYLRYMGEMQIIKANLPADERVNVVAQITPEDIFLLPYIQPGGSFRFKAVN